MINIDEAISVIEFAETSLTNSGDETEDLVDPQRAARVHLAQREIFSRNKRTKFVRTDLLGEPFWDILLDLYVADYFKNKLCTKSICLASRTSLTTCLRRIDYLEQIGLVERYTSMEDKRATLVRIAFKGQQMIDQYYSDQLENLRVVAENLSGKNLFPASVHETD